MVSSSSDNEVQEIDINNVVKKIRERERALLDSIKQESKPVQKQTGSPGLNLNIIGIERTWLRVVTDKTDTSEYMLDKGRRIRLSADNCFEFLIGRADGLQLQYNGKTIRSLGESNQVIRYMLLDSSGIVAKRMIIPQKRPIADDDSL
jgi:hypothetical protein